MEDVSVLNIYDLIRYVGIRSDCEQLNDMMITWIIIRRVVEWSSHCLIWGIILAFAWKDWGKLQKNLSQDSHTQWRSNWWHPEYEPEVLLFEPSCSEGFSTSQDRDVFFFLIYIYIQTMTIRALLFLLLEVAYLYLEDGGTIFLQNVGTCQSYWMMSWPWRPQYKLIWYSGGWSPTVSTRHCSH
jgi:hypothetical protein